MCADNLAARRADLLRLITCGSVDDGKSTLIGRMLHDTRSIHRDQLEAVRRTSARRGSEHLDLSLLTDGLRAEREQGITIDVAYRYFSTPTRSFILADTPGHVQYTRNMATGASTADAAIILVDARQGVLEQTRRHACLAALLGISHLIVCVNKMDLVGFDRARFEEIRRDFEGFMRSASDAQTVGGERGWFDAAEATFIPISALLGDNVVGHSEHMPWHAGPSLLEHLETVPARPLHELHAARFPVQWVIRPQRQEHHDYRGLAGQIVAGELRVGDDVVALPSGQSSRVTRIHLGERELESCRPPQSVTLLLADDLDIGRGEVLVRSVDADNPAAAPLTGRDIDATIVWMHREPISTGRRYLVKHLTRTLACTVGAIEHRLNIRTLRPETGVTQLGLNEIGRATFRLASPIVFDPYVRCRATGAFIVIDEASNETVGAGILRRPPQG